MITKDIKSDILKRVRVDYTHIARYIRTCDMNCGSAFEPGASGLPYYCTPPVCVPAVIGALAVWRQNTKNELKSVLLQGRVPREK